VQKQIVVSAVKVRPLTEVTFVIRGAQEWLSLKRYLLPNAKLRESLSSIGRSPMFSTIRVKLIRTDSAIMGVRKSSKIMATAPTKLLIKILSNLSPDEN
jgi:hypothetical protein